MKYIELAFIKLFRWLFDFGAKMIGPRSKNVRHADYYFNNIKIRVYFPSNKLNLPIIIYYHGGGFLIGSIRAYEPLCQYIAEKTGYILVIVDYRLAPLYKFPTAHQDAINAYNFIIKNAEIFGGNPSQIIMAGDSAGANLMLNIPANILSLILIYPLIDVNIKYSTNLFQMVRNFCIKRYFDGVTHQNLGKTKACEQYIIIADLDILKYEAMKYAYNQPNIIIKNYKYSFHGFLQFAGISKVARVALDELVIYIQSLET